MPIQLDKILADIAEEKALHPFSSESSVKKDQDDAWIRVGRKNKLSAHEAKSIFKVLQKKYEQEKLKSVSTWKLYQQMEEILRKEEQVKPKAEHEEPTEAEEESFVEFLEVREEEDDYDGDSDNQSKSMKSNSSTGSPEKDTANNATDTKPEQKLLNSHMMLQSSNTAKIDYSSSNPQQKQVNAAFSNVLQKKGISMRKTSPASKTPTPTTTTPSQTAKSLSQRSVFLPEGIKRKLQNVERREEAGPAKKSALSTPSGGQTQQVAHATVATVPPADIKQEVMDDVQTSHATTTTTGEGISVITIPSNPTTVNTDLGNGITTIKTNGFNTRLEDLDFHKDIIFDNRKPSNTSGEIINIGNFENQLPPTFFKNLCNSQRHEALGLYVANVMNRVTGKTATKLELNILKAIMEAQTDELAKV